MHTIMYLARPIQFCFCQACKSVPHMCYVDISNIHAPMKYMWAPSSVEVQSYSTSNVLNHQNGQFLHQTITVKTFFTSHLLSVHIKQQPVSSFLLFEEDTFICCLTSFIPETAPYVENSSMCSCVVLHNILTFIQTSHTTIQIYG